MTGPQNIKFACPCCGHKTLATEASGTYDICVVCFWEDDGVQLEDVDYEGGANGPSLRQAQQNYAAFGACDERCVSLVRPPKEDELRDKTWKPLG